MRCFEIDDLEYIIDARIDIIYFFWEHLLEEFLHGQAHFFARDDLSGDRDR